MRSAARRTSHSRASLFPRSTASTTVGRNFLTSRSYCSSSSVLDGKSFWQEMRGKLPLLALAGAAFAAFHYTIQVKTLTPP